MDNDINEEQQEEHQENLLEKEFQAKYDQLTNKYMKGEKTIPIYQIAGRFQDITNKIWKCKISMDIYEKEMRDLIQYMDVYN